MILRTLCNQNLKKFMNYNIIFLFFVIFSFNKKSLMSQNFVYDFDNQSNISNWIIVNDDVMGGLSTCKIRIDEKGNGVFEGLISTANNGGFSSIRLNLNMIDISTNSYFIIKLKGDNKKYQFRIKKNISDYHYYVKSFQTSSEWETIKIDLKDMYPVFRGSKLNMKNFNYDYFQQITFLVANKKNEKFKLLIDSIELVN
tara:strand:- start:866 stop:1462 length:597 start_codon:yes stop_codon:yes gene_type:complete